MNTENNLTITMERISANKCKVKALWRDDPAHADEINPHSATHRTRLCGDLVKKLPQLEDKVGEIEKELLRQADDMDKQKPVPTAPEPDEDSAELLAKMPSDIRAEAEAMLGDPVLIMGMTDDVAALSVAGEKELIATVYLVGVSRLLEKPLAAIVQGPSSSGKSYLVDKVASLFPPEAVIFATQMTPQALFHMKPGTLSHRFVVAGERSRVEDDDRAEATRALREMLSSGKLTKLMPVKVEGNRIETVSIAQEGPIAFIETTTLSKIFDEDANRCFLLQTDEQPNQTRRILDCLASSYDGSNVLSPNERIILRHHALQRMLKPMPVIVPFAQRLGGLFPSDRVEVRRAFPQFMAMIQAITLLHQRQRNTDEDGRLVATADDYQLARRLLAKPLSRLLGGAISDPARRFLERLKQWAHGAFTSTEARNAEKNCKSSVYGWLSELYEAGHLEMPDAPRGRSPAKWLLASLDREEPSVICLPTVETVFPEMARTHGNNAECPEFT